MNALRRLRLMFGLTALLLGIAIGFNYLVDPYGAWGNRLVHPIFRQIKRERLATPYFVWTAQPRVLLIGSSRMLMGIRIDQGERDGAYHQGTVWGWLLGHFVKAHLRVHQDPAAAASFLAPVVHHLQAQGLGTVGEIYDADPPFTPRGCIAQAWTVAGILEAWEKTAMHAL